MATDIKQFLTQYVKATALRLGGEEAIADIEGGGGGGDVIPSTAKLYIPDTEGIIDDIVYILENEPISATDAVFGNFISPRMIDLGSFVDAAAFYNKGIYEQNDYDLVLDSGTIPMRNIGYSGVLDFGVLETESTTPTFAGANTFLQLGFEDNTYISPRTLCEFTLNTETKINYSFNGIDATAIETKFLFEQSTTLVRLDVTVNNAGAEPAGTYSITFISN